MQDHREIGAAACSLRRFELILNNIVSIMLLQKMSQDTGLLQTLEEDLGLSNLASKNDQRTFASFCHCKLIGSELGWRVFVE